MTEEEKEVFETIKEDYKCGIEENDIEVHIFIEHLYIILNLIEKLKAENENLKAREKEHQELNGRLRQYIKELEEKVEKYRSDWE